MPVENSRRSGPGRGPVTFSNVPTHVDPGRADPGRSKLPRYARRSGPRSGRSWSAIRAQLVRDPGSPIWTRRSRTEPIHNYAIKKYLRSAPIWSAIRADLVRDPRAGAPGAIEAIREFWPGDHVQMRARVFYSGRVHVQVSHKQSSEKTI